MEGIEVTLQRNKQFVVQNIEDYKVIEGENNATNILVHFPSEYQDYSKRVDFRNTKNEKWTISLYAPEEENNQYGNNFDKLNFLFTLPRQVTLNGEMQVQFIAYKADDAETLVPFEILKVFVKNSVLYVRKTATDNPDLIVSAYNNSNKALEISRDAFNRIENAERSAVNAQNSANAAQTSASKAEASAKAAQTSATNSNTRAVNAENSAKESQQSAEYAERVSNEANTKSDNAVSTANTANTKSTNAVNTANSANTKSDNAVKTANTANTKSDNAVAVANTANSKSDNAVSTANSAKNTAEEALNQVVEKMGTKIFVGSSTTPEANMDFESDPQTQINKIKNNTTTIANASGGFSCGTGSSNTDGFTFKDFTICDKNGKIPVGRLLDAIYPVGSIYISANSASPSTLFGGTWERIQDKFLLASGSTYSAGSTGGEASHTLTSNEMPSHSHNNTISVSASQSSHRHRLLTYSGHTRQGVNNTYSPCSNSGDLGNYWGVAGTGADTYAENGGTYQQDWATYAAGYSDCAKNGSKGNNTRPIVEGSTPAISVSHSISNANTGGGTAHNNMPPYLSVYVWKRTA